ncbi:hypothetical protein [Halorubellus sp. PRR65]|uniref:hypothetical protein n=1 Tax=Halorubellus sp. PRR65 TaxID=3098148 RepID=UPI002B257684|nr:hypothetical protein [Halorubellus sp. PRR65]
MYPLQLTSFLNLIPAWLPTATLSAGTVLVLFGLTRRYVTSADGPLSSLPYHGYPLIITVTLSVAAATYTVIQRFDMTLLFVVQIFFTGRLIQGALTARIIGKVIDAIEEIHASLTTSTTKLHSQSLPERAYSYILTKLKDRLTIIIATGIISTYTTISVLAVFLIGDGVISTAIKRFWIGYFFLITAGLVFDFRHFAHRLPLLAGVGLIIAIVGAFLYQPVSFSAYLTQLGPYLETPIPDWARYPISAIGFLCGFLFWALFYNQHRTTQHNHPP